MPADTQLLYVDTMTVTRYPHVLVSTLGIAFITIVVPLSYYGVTKVQPRKLATSLLTSLLLLGGLILGGRAAHSFLVQKQPNPYLHFTLEADLAEATEVTVHRDASSADEQGGPSTMDRIRQTGRLRVGFGPHVIPFSYFNAANDLVG